MCSSRTSRTSLGSPSRSILKEVRAVQSRYFEAARGTVSVYGGLIEKFIGDAVVAVWGAAVAHEDDAERAVRAALDLVAAVGQLAGSTAGDRLAARAAVATGEAAVGVTEGQGLVSGDVVNTAARLQTAAATATVLVDERTERAVGRETGVMFVPAGPFQLKGRPRRSRPSPRRSVIGPVAAGAQATLAPSSAGTRNSARSLRCSMRRRLMGAVGWRQCSGSPGSARAV